MRQQSNTTASSPFAWFHCAMGRSDASRIRWRARSKDVSSDSSGGALSGGLDKEHEMPTDYLRRGTRIPAADDESPRPSYPDAPHYLLERSREPTVAAGKDVFWPRGMTTRSPGPRSALSFKAGLTPQWPWMTKNQPFGWTLPVLCLCLFIELSELRSGVHCPRD